jgi:hypothetical protein
MSFTVNAVWSDTGLTGTAYFTPEPAGGAAVVAAISGGVMASTTLPTGSPFYLVTFSGLVSGQQQYENIGPVQFATPSDGTTLNLMAISPSIANPVVLGGVTVSTPANPLLASKNLADVSSASAARANLGLSAVATRRVQLTDNCYATSLNVNVTNVGTYRELHHVGISGTDIQLGFGNWYDDGTTTNVDHDPTTSVTFAAGFEDASGQVYQCFFGGQKTVTLPPGGFVLADPLPIDVVAGTSVFVRVYLSSGTALLNKSTGVSWIGSSYGGFTATTDLTATGAAATGSGTGSAWGPMCIIGTPTAAGKSKSLVVQGDSVVYGEADGLYGGISAGNWGPSYQMLSGGGYIMRALSGSAGILMEAFPGDSAHQFVSGLGHFRRGLLTKYGTSGLVTYGVNDLALGRTQAQLEADLLTIGYSDVAKGLLGIVVPTLTPKATSTDSFKTVGNQTTDPLNTARIAHNAWVRGGCPIIGGAAVAVGTAGALLAGQPGHPILGYIEVADVIESARDSGKWKAPNRVVTDAAMSTGASTTLTSATANWTSADLGLDVVVAGAGASGAALTAQILVVNSSTSVTVDNACSTTVSAAQCMIGPSTLDGLHPSTGGNAAIAAAVQSPLLALLS